MILVALLRRANVGGAGRLPMAEFRDMLTGMDLRGVRTCIPSSDARITGGGGPR